MGCNEFGPVRDAQRGITPDGITPTWRHRQQAFAPALFSSHARSGRLWTGAEQTHVRGEVAMQAVPRRKQSAEHRLPGLPSRASRRKPGAMWNAVPVAPHTSIVCSTHG